MSTNISRRVKISKSWNTNLKTAGDQGDERDEVDAPTEGEL